MTALDANLAVNQLLDTALTSDGIVEVIDNYRGIASLNQLQNTVAPYIASSTCHEDLFRHGLLKRNRKILGGREKVVSFWE